MASLSPSLKAYYFSCLFGRKIISSNLRSVLKSDPRTNTRSDPLFSCLLQKELQKIILSHCQTSAGATQSWMKRGCNEDATRMQRGCNEDQDATRIRMQRGSRCNEVQDATRFNLQQGSRSRGPNSSTCILVF